MPSTLSGSSTVISKPTTSCYRLVRVTFKVEIITVLFVYQSIPILDSTASSAEEMFSGNSPTIQLIDFGRSIDLTLLPSNVSFNKVFISVSGGLFYFNDIK